MTDEPRSSRTTVFVQVLVAALFLAVIGGSVGLVLGLRDRDGSSNPDGSTQTQTLTQNGPACPQEIADQAGQSKLTQELYVQTKRSEVWICRDAGDNLYYQGHRGDPEDRPIAGDEKDWLFLRSVTRNGAEYQAVNISGDGTTTYRVSRTELVIENPGNEPEVQPVVQAIG